MKYLARISPNKKLMHLFLAWLVTCIPALANSEIAEEYFKLALEAQKNQEPEKADRYFKKATELDPNNVALHSYLGTSYALKDDYIAALEHYIKALPYKPKDVSLFYNTAHCLREIGLSDDAVGYYNRAIELKPDHEGAHQGRAYSLLTIGKYLEAWPDYEYRMQPPLQSARKFAEYVQRNGSLKGKRVVLRGVFGFGDTFQFVRFAQLVKRAGAHVTVEAQKPTLEILKLCPYIDQVKEDVGITPTNNHFTLLMSLPWAFDITVDTIPNKPYLYADQKLVNEWQQKLSHDKKFKIGICWNSFFEKKRAMPLELLKPLTQIPDLSIYSLQKETGVEQLKNLSTDFNIHTFDEDFDDKHGRFMDTAAVMQNLDLIITVDTSIAHLAGGMGLPVWLMILNVADWRWLQERDDSPWYPTMRIFRQPKPGDWKSVVENVCNELKKEIQKKK
jgi:hypothetical protein